VLGLFAAVTEMDWTGQVCTRTVGLENPLAEAKIMPWPGTLAVTIAWFNTVVVGGVEVRFTMLEPPEGVTCCQVKGPTLGVMSVEPLIAVA
jgi:hypothetical protein